MTRRFALLFAVTLLAIACRAQQGKSHSGASLNDTLQWMQQSLGPKGITYQDRNGWSYYSAAPHTHYTELIKTFSYEGCGVRIVKNIETANPLLGKEPFLSEETDTFSLSDLDPKSVNLDYGDGTLEGHVVTVSTANDKKAIHCQTINKNVGKNYNKDAGCMPADDDAEQLRFSTKEYAQRFSKALSHAIELCGGKPSAF